MLIPRELYTNIVAQKLHGTELKFRLRHKGRWWKPWYIEIWDTRTEHYRHSNNDEDRWITIAEDPSFWTQWGAKRGARKSCFKKEFDV